MSAEHRCTAIPMQRVVVVTGVCVFMCVTGEAQGLKGRSFSDKSSISRPPTRPPDPPSRLLNKTPNEDSPAS